MISLPEPILHNLYAALVEIGDSSPILSVESISGGCINNARRLTTAQSTYFLKWNPRIPRGFFQAEARGLDLIRKTGAVHVPIVLAVNEPSSSDSPPFLLLEWLSPQSGYPSHFDQAQLGEALARLHQFTHPQYGLDHDNFIGPTPQQNRWEKEWIDFYREQRLYPQIHLASRLQNLTSRQSKKLDRLMARLDEWLSGVDRRPSLLHGDLWAGNVMTGPQVESVLIDPAVYYGDREAEIAYTELFGGFGARFYQAYQAVWPLEPDYASRRDLYNLYHLLNHLNLFGESYSPQIDAILDRYVG